MKAIKATAAGLLILLIIIAPPFLLIRYIGNPWPPEGIDLNSPLTDNAVLGLIAVLVWILWAQFTLSLIVELYAAAADKAVDVRLPVFGFQQDLARALVGAVLTTVALAPAVTGAMNTTAAAADVPATTATTTMNTTLVQQATPARAPTTHTAHQQNQQEAGPVQVTVERGETLWSLAERYLGDGDKWTTIAEANQGKTMSDGRLFTSADQIRAGWILTIPGAAAVDDKPGDIPPKADSYQVQTGDTLSSIAEEQLGDPNAYPAIFAASQGITQPGGNKLTDPNHIEPEWTLAIPGQNTSEGKHRSHTRADKDTHQDEKPKQTSPEPASPTQDPSNEATPAPETSVPATEAESQSTAADVVDQVDSDEAWPVKTVGGVGAVLGGLLIGLLARRRAGQRRRRKPGERLPLPEATAESVETDVRAVADEVGVEFVDVALRSLAGYTVTSQTALPQLQAARMTPAQLDLYFSAAPEQPLPSPWQATSDPSVWVLPVDQRHLLDGVDPALPALWPALASVGHDAENGVILLNLAQLQGLAVTGDHHLTSQVMIALAVELGTAPWAADMDLTVIGSLVELADVLDRGRMRYVPTSHNVHFEGGEDRVHVVIAMSPLNDEQEQQLLDRGASVVIQTPTLAGREHQGWSIDLIDAEHATVQPIGLQINPQRVDSATYAAILEMLTASLADPMRPGADQVVPFDRGQKVDPQPPAPRIPDNPSARHPSMRGRSQDGPRPTAGVGNEHGVVHDPGLHMVDGNTMTATRTVPEPPLMLVDRESPWTQDTFDVVDDVTDVETKDLLNIEEMPADLVEPRDVPSEEEPAAEELDDELNSAEVTSQVEELIEQEPEPEEAPAVEAEIETEVIEHPMIRLLGPTVEIVGTKTAAPTSESHLRVCTRVATYLALNPDTTRAALVHAIWNGRRVSSTTVDSRISQLRNWLGDNPDTGEAYLPRRSLRFSDAVTTDWNHFVDLVGTDPTQASTQALEAAVRLIRGRPLEGEDSKHYGFAEYFASDVIDILADATYELGRRRYMAGEWTTAGSAAALGIRVDPANEALWRLRIHAAHSAGDATGITEAIDRMHARITELGFELDEQTTELLEAIANHDAEALAEARAQI